jgi:hypothetical protein
MTNIGENSIVDAVLKQLLQRGWEASAQPQGDAHVISWDPHFYNMLRWVVLPGNSGTFLGCELNKGLDRAARGYNASSRLIMQRPWVWKLVGEDAIAAKLSEYGTSTVNLEVTSGLIPGFTPEETPFRHRFSWQCDNGHLLLNESVYDVSNVGALSQYTELSQVFQHLTRLAEYRWLWVRVTWGHTVAKGSVEAALEDLIKNFGTWYHMENEPAIAPGG